MFLYDFCKHYCGTEPVTNIKTKQNSFVGGGWGNADCLKSKAELPINGGLAFLLEKRR